MIIIIVKSQFILLFDCILLHKNAKHKLKKTKKVERLHVSIIGRSLLQEHKELLWHNQNIIKWH